MIEEAATGRIPEAVEALLRIDDTFQFGLIAVLDSSTRPIDSHEFLKHQSEKFESVEGQVSMHRSALALLLGDESLFTGSSPRSPEWRDL